MQTGGSNSNYYSEKCRGEREVDNNNNNGNNNNNNREIEEEEEKKKNIKTTIKKNKEKKLALILDVDETLISVRRWFDECSVGQKVWVKATTSATTSTSTSTSTTITSAMATTYEQMHNDDAGDDSNNENDDGNNEDSKEEDSGDWYAGVIVTVHKTVTCQIISGSREIVDFYRVESIKDTSQQGSYQIGSQVELQHAPYNGELSVVIESATRKIEVEYEDKYLNRMVCKTFHVDYTEMGGDLKLLRYIPHTNNEPKCAPIEFVCDNFYLVRFRPGLAQFLYTASRSYHIILWTAAVKELYSRMLQIVHDKLLQYLDDTNNNNIRLWEEMYFREDCRWTHEMLWKDVTCLPGFISSQISLKDIVIIDNVPRNFRGFETNVLPIANFVGQSDDAQLLLYSSILQQLVEKTQVSDSIVEKTFAITTTTTTTIDVRNMLHEIASQYESMKESISHMKKSNQSLMRKLLCQGNSSGCYSSNSSSNSSYSLSKYAPMKSKAYRNRFHDSRRESDMITLAGEEEISEEAVALSNAAPMQGIVIGNACTNIGQITSSTQLFKTKMNDDHKLGIQSNRKLETWNHNDNISRSKIHEKLQTRRSKNDNSDIYSDNFSRTNNLLLSTETKVSEIRLDEDSNSLWKTRTQSWVQSCGNDDETEENKVLKECNQENPYEEPQSEDMDMMTPYEWCQVVLTHDNESEIHDPTTSLLSLSQSSSLIHSSHEITQQLLDNPCTEEKKEEHSTPFKLGKEFEREANDDGHTLGDDNGDNGSRTASMFSWSRGWMKPIPIDEEPSDSPCSQDSVIHEDPDYRNSLQFEYEDACNNGIKNIQLDRCESLSLQEQDLTKYLNSKERSYLFPSSSIDNDNPTSM